jgi:hypothetical protein
MILPTALDASLTIVLTADDNRLWPVTATAAMATDDNHTNQKHKHEPCPLSHETL